MSDTGAVRGRGLLRVIGPGLLVAATGVGAGDLATGAFAGSQVGLAVLWAVLVGAAMKFAVNEGLARWQLATGTTLLEGAVAKLGILVAIVFLPYLVLWSFFVASALMSACGATMHAMVPVFDDPVIGKRVFGVAHSLLGLALVLRGGYRLFERVMSVCIGVMFVTVMVTAFSLWPGTGAVARGLLPDPSSLRGDDLQWTVALMGGVGGTVTVLCYGYWMRESGRESGADLGVCRIDLATAYTMTAIFGISMVIIGSTVPVEGKGAALLVTLADRLSGPLGSPGRWAFLIGAWGAVFSSLLGVWQAVPYIFADLCGQLGRRRGGVGSVNGEPVERFRVETRSLAYRASLLGIAIVPALGLVVDFRRIQKLYAITGAFFVPLLALALLILNGRADWVGDRRNRWLATIALIAVLVFFAWYGWVSLTGSPA